ncbi:SET domain-containing protein [Tothia fuscella]|uniref:SET domain-containing protein n=1 Tax=Tothia fuscella TaxID=1048955 RepID=A0A9P4TXN7_9PEZI|nr:SET domain-containing protein [Tothia fuscella]
MAHPATPQSAPPPVAKHFIVPSIANKGQGMRAVRLLRAGERILVEDPILLLRTSTSADQFVREELTETTTRVSDTVRSLYNRDNARYQTFRKLHTNPRSTPSTPQLTDYARENLSRFFTNAIWFPSVARIVAVPGAPDSQPAFAVMKDMSRTNHSCRPNATIHWNANLQSEGFFNNVKGRATLHAMRDIPAGEEITISYNRPQAFDPGLKRRITLQLRWGFLCTCPACYGSDVPQSELSRAELTTLGRQLIEYTKANPQYTAHDHSKKVIDAVHRMMQLMREEGIMDDILISV